MNAVNGKVGNVQLMQKINRLKVLSCIRKNPFIVRPAVAEQTGLSLASITNIVSFLIDKGLVAETGFETADRIGRKAVLLKFCSEARNLICVLITERRIRVSLTDLSGEEIKSISSDFEFQTPKEALSVIEDAIERLLSESERENVLAIGVAVSAFVLPDGTVAVASKLRWDRADLKSDLSKKFSLPVFVVDTSVARGHYCNEHIESEEEDNVLFLDLSDGVGAVHFYSGHQNMSVIGQIGHTTLEKDGDECFCGNRGCLEVMCSLDRADEQYRKSGKGSQFQGVIDGFNNGEKTATEILKRSGKYLGMGMANAINVLNSKTVIINAGQFKNCDAVLGWAIEEAKTRVLSAMSEKIDFRVTDISDLMLTEGVAQCLCEHIFDVDFEGNIF